MLRSSSWLFSAASTIAAAILCRPTIGSRPGSGEYPMWTSLSHSSPLEPWALGRSQIRSGVTTGAVARLAEDGLAWVVAHEIAHIEHEDGRRRQHLSAPLVE